MSQPTIPAVSRLMMKPTEAQPEEVKPTVELLPTDWCDHRVCGEHVAANVAILVNAGKLTFCSHHYNENAVALVPFIRAFVRNEVR